MPVATFICAQCGEEVTKRKSRLVNGSRICIDNYASDEISLIYRYPIRLLPAPSQQMECIVTKDGKCWNVYTNKWMQPHKKTNNIHISHFGKRWNFSLHIEMAKVWLTNPHNKRFVAFRDNDRKHIHIDNLVWSFSSRYIVGEDINGLKILDDVGITEDRNTLVKWKCHCGIKKVSQYRHLLSGNTTSCGCSKVKHGERYSVLYGRLRNIHERCYNPNSINYQYYGAKGITVCDEWSPTSGDWSNAIHNFIVWAEIEGWSDGCDLTIDRIISTGNYEPSNCRLVTADVQNSNRNTVINVTIGDRTQCIAKWCKEYNIPISTIHSRISNGYNTKAAFLIDKRVEINE